MQTQGLAKYSLSKAEKRTVIFMILPALAEALLSHTFSLVDSAMLGHASDAATAIAAVGICTPLSGFLLNVMSAFCVGTTATVAWFLGSRSPKDAKITAQQTLLVTGGLGLILSLICFFGTDTIVQFMGCEDPAVFQGARDYFAIISIGFFFHFMTYNIGAALRGVKITKYTMYYNVIANSVNVGLNYVLIFGKLGFEPMGIKGAAIATVASQVIAFILAFAVISIKKTPVQFSFKESFLPTRRILNRVIKIGSTAAVEQVILQGGNVLFTKIIAGIPKIQFSAYSVASRISGFIWNVGGSCAIASTTYMGIHLGEGREDKCRGYTSFITRTSFTWMCVLTGLLVLFSKPLCHLFTSDLEVAKEATMLLPLAACCGFPVAIHQPIAGALRGAGDTRSPLIASFGSLWVFRVFLGWILVGLCGLNIFYAQIAVAGDQCARMAIDWYLYRKGYWTKRLRPKENN